MGDWKYLKNILCIRLDHMGDVLMSGPAIKALKKHFNAKITLLTSVKGAPVAKLMPYIDEVLTFDAPWMKADQPANGQHIFTFAEELRKRWFDACAIFTVFSQSALPAAMLAWQAGIPNRLAYSRENPYSLLTHWIPDKEPYEVVRHQVQRDLDMVREIGVVVDDTAIQINLPTAVMHSAYQKLRLAGVDMSMPFLVMHMGVSEAKREFPLVHWKELVQYVAKRNLQMVFTGNDAEQLACRQICTGEVKNVFDLSGKLTLEEFAAVLEFSTVIVTVNTCTVHLASALEKPVVVLYARTNPQHSPWMTKNKVLEYSIAETQKSKNKVIAYIDQVYYADFKAYPSPAEIFDSIMEMVITNAR